MSAKNSKTLLIWVHNLRCYDSSKKFRPNFHDNMDFMITKIEAKRGELIMSKEF